MKRLLQTLFTAILGFMLWVTVTASLDRGMMEAGRELWQSAWFRATLADTYFAFLTFFLWVAYKQTTWLGRFLWFVLIMALGNIAISIYMLIELAKMQNGDGMEKLLLRRAG